MWKQDQAGVSWRSHLSIWMSRGIVHFLTGKHVEMPPPSEAESDLLSLRLRRLPVMTLWDSHSVCCFFKDIAELCSGKADDEEGWMKKITKEKMRRIYLQNFRIDISVCSNSEFECVMLNIWSFYRLRK